MRYRVTAYWMLMSALASGSVQAAACNMGSGQVSFGKINPLQPETLQTVGSLVITCDAPVAWAHVRFSSGHSQRAGWREMRSGEYRLGYNLYADMGRQHILGDGAPGAQGLDLSFPDAGQPIHVSIFAEIEPRQEWRAGIYTDEIIVTVEF